MVSVREKEVSVEFEIKLNPAEWAEGIELIIAEGSFLCGIIYEEEGPCRGVVKFKWELGHRRSTVHESKWTREILEAQGLTGVFHLRRMGEIQNQGFLICPDCGVVRVAPTKVLREIWRLAELDTQHANYWWSPISLV